MQDNIASYVMFTLQDIGDFGSPHQRDLQKACIDQTLTGTAQHVQCYTYKQDNQIKIEN